MSPRSSAAWAELAGLGARWSALVELHTLLRLREILPATRLREVEMRLHCYADPEVATEIAHRAAGTPDRLLLDLVVAGDGPAMLTAAQIVDPAPVAV